MPTIPRFPIHIPYFLNRFRTDDPEEIRVTANQVMSELHRYLRYLGNTTDNDQSNFQIIDGEVETLETDKLGHARVMIRVSCGF